MRSVLVLAACSVLAGCSTPSLNLGKADLQPANVKTAIAKMVLRSPHSGRFALFEARIVNARITPGEQRNASIFYGKQHVYYCVRGEIKNPLFPLNQHFYAEVMVSDESGSRNINVRTSQLACGSPAQPFSELEAVSANREADRSA